MCTVHTAIRHYTCIKTISVLNLKYCFGNEFPFAEIRTLHVKYIPRHDQKTSRIRHTVRNQIVQMVKINTCSADTNTIAGVCVCVCVCY